MPPLADQEERVIVVDAADQPLGTAPKLAVHRDGTLHRAVSVVVTTPDGRVLLQQRAAGKYHSPGLWTNSACGHPRPGETALAAAERRLYEEMGIRCLLEPVGTFCYRAVLEGGMIEHEIDHVFVGVSDAGPVPAPAEVQASHWLPFDALERDVTERPDLYTAWLAPVLRIAGEHPVLAAGRSAVESAS